MTLKILASVVLLTGIWKVSGQGLLEEYAGWTHLDFANGTTHNHVPENAIIIGIQVSFINRRPTKKIITKFDLEFELTGKTHNNYEVCLWHKLIKILA
jgi:hypothetical protein